MQIQSAIEMEYPRVGDLLNEDSSLYQQIIYGLVGVIAGLAGFMILVL